MSEKLHTDSGILNEIAGTLRKSASELDNAGSSAPRAPDAGKAGPAVAAILAKLVGDAGELVVAAETSADAVAKGGKAYVEADENAKDSVNAVGPN